MWAKWLSLMLCLLLFISASGCGTADKAKDHVNLTIWHVYGDQSDSPLNRLIEQFNSTAGKEQGIHVVVTSVASTNNIHHTVLSAATGEPGAPALPDLFISYPKTIAALDDKSILVDFSDYFTDTELSGYIQAFLDEGYFDEKLLIFPIAKSTEVLYVNNNQFSRFAADTGAKLDDLLTWEGLFDLACRYYEWTDAITPDVSGDGKAFFAHGYPFHYFQVGVASLSEPFFKNGKLTFGEAYEAVWKPLARAGIAGGLWLDSDAATSGPMRTGDVVCTIGSSASFRIAPREVAYQDNTTEDMDLILLPCPVFEKGEKLVVRRGAGICCVKSEAEREAAAAVFIKWLTGPETNTNFATEAGYLPVTIEANEKYLEKVIDSLEMKDAIDLYEVVFRQQSQYEYYQPPNLPNYLKMEEMLSYGVLLAIKDARGKYISDPGISLDELVDESYLFFKSFLADITAD